MGTISNREAARAGLVGEGLIIRREEAPKTEAVRGEGGESYFESTPGMGLGTEMSAGFSRSNWKPEDLDRPKMFAPVRFPLSDYDFIGAGGGAMGFQQAARRMIDTFMTDHGADGVKQYIPQPLLSLPEPPTREDEIRQTRALLAADAERAPTFAAARKAAILNAFEKHPSFASDLLTSLLAGLHAYEDLRGWKAAPDEAAQVAAARAYWKERNGSTASHVSIFLSEAIAVYEQRRGLR